MHYSAKSQRFSNKVKNRNGQMPPYGTGMHILPAPNVSNLGQLQINRKYVNNMANVNEVSVLHYQRTTNMQIKNHNLEMNHFQNMGHQQAQAFVYKTPQYHNHLNPHLQQKFPGNHPIQRKFAKENLIRQEALHQYSNKNGNSKKTNDFRNLVEVNTLNNTVTPKNVRKPYPKPGNGHEEIKSLNSKDGNVSPKNHEKVPVNCREQKEEEVKDTKNESNKTETQQDMEQILSINTEHPESNLCVEVNNKTTKDSREKTPMCLINDLARFNKINFQYRLTGENGPAHCKRFTVTLRLGDEEYTAEGLKIKQAQHSAAQEAIEKTKYKHPTPKRTDVFKSNITPTVELNALAMKLGQQTCYVFDSNKVGNNENYRFDWQPYQKIPATAREPAIGMVENVGINNGKYFQTVVTQKRHFLSKFQNTYAPYQHSLNNSSSPVGRKYYPFTSPCKVTLLVGTKEFLGVGKDLQQAKHNAASNALKVLKEEMHNDTRDENIVNADSKSPISMVFEIGIKRNLPVGFKVLREEGPAHMRTFITACTVGNITTEAEGNGKKMSKKKAAQKMLEELAKLPPLPPADSQAKHVILKTSRKKFGNQAKNVHLAETKEGKPKKCHKKEADRSEEGNPITKVLEWHKNKNQEEPVYKLIKEFSKENAHKKHYLMEINSNQITARGVGYSKKLAKQNAAEKFLMAVAETEQSSSSSAENNSITKDANSSETKEVESKLLQEEKSKSLQLSKESSSYVQDKVEKITNTSPSVTSAASSQETKNAPNTTSSSRTKSHHMKEKLLYLSKLLGFDVEFSDYNKGIHDDVLSIVMLSTDPPQICHGMGVNSMESREDAAKSALEILSEMGLNSVINA